MAEKEEQEVKQEEKPLEQMTVKELREIAREIPGVSGFSVMKKEELMALIKKERGVEEGEEEEKVPEKPLEAEKPPEAERPVDREKPLEKQTAKELREIAKDIPGVTGVTAMKKEELLAIIKQHRGIKDERPAKKKKVKGDKPIVSIKELKERIVALRVEKEAARQANDRHKVDILRRRINRFKKRTRKAAQG